MTALIKEFAKTNIQGASMMDSEVSGKLAILSAKHMHATQQSFIVVTAYIIYTKDHV